MKSNFTGFVLAGGKSARMGTDKYNLKIGDETLLTRAARALKSSCETVKIGASRTQEIATDEEIVRDIYENRGAPGAIHAALSTCATDFAIILAVDLPLVNGEALEKLAAAALASNKFLAVVAREMDGRAQPLCAAYRVKYCLPILENLLAENVSVSAQDFLDLIYPKYIDAARLSNNENLLFNVNRPEDFEKLQTWNQ